MISGARTLPRVDDAPTLQDGADTVSARLALSYYEASGERALWVAVLMTALNDLEPKKPVSHDPQMLNVTRARSWFGTRDFYMVCALAGFDGEVLMGHIKPVLEAKGNFGLRSKKLVHNKR